MLGLGLAAYASQRFQTVGLHLLQAARDHQTLLGEHGQGAGCRHHLDQSDFLQIEEFAVEPRAVFRRAKNLAAQGRHHAVDEKALRAVQAVDGRDLAALDGAQQIGFFPRRHAIGLPYQRYFKRRMLSPSTT